MLKKIFFITFVTAGQAIAADQFIDLAHNLDQLNRTILKTESALSKQLSPEERNELEQLKAGLIEIKSRHSEYNDTAGLEEAQKMASTRGWINTINFLNKIQASCSQPDKAEDECFMELSEFDKFIDSRGIAESDKEKLHQLMNSYAKYNEAKLALNAQLIQTTNKLLLAYEHKLHEETKPLATVSLVPAGTPKKEVKRSLAPVVAAKTDEAVPSSWYYAAGAGILALGVLLKLWSSSKRKKATRTFYSAIFISAKKHRLKARIFGNVSRKNFQKMIKIKRSYLDFLNASSVMGVNMDVKFKNRGKKMVIDTIFHVQKPVQEWMAQESSAGFSQNIENFEKVLHDYGGELSVTNTFDNEGRLTSSYFTVEV